MSNLSLNTLISIQKCKYYSNKTEHVLNSNGILTFNEIAIKILVEQQ